MADAARLTGEKLATLRESIYIKNQRADELEAANSGSAEAKLLRVQADAEAAELRRFSDAIDGEAPAAHDRLKRNAAAAGLHGENATEHPSIRVQQAGAKPNAAEKPIAAAAAAGAAEPVAAAAASGSAAPPAGVTVPSTPAASAYVVLRNGGTQHLSSEVWKAFVHRDAELILKQEIKFVQTRDGWNDQGFTHEKLDQLSDDVQIQGVDIFVLGVVLYRSRVLHYGDDLKGRRVLLPPGAKYKSSDEASRQPSGFWDYSNKNKTALNKLGLLIRSIANLPLRRGRCPTNSAIMPIEDA
jgi:hypothetical protein